MEALVIVGKPKHGRPEGLVRGPRDKAEKMADNTRHEAMEMPAEEKAEHSMDGKYVKPEAVGYRSSEEKCSTCEYMGKDGQCSWLGMPVEPEASCALHEFRDEAAETPGEEADGSNEQPKGTM